MRAILGNACWITALLSYPCIIFCVNLIVLNFGEVFFILNFLHFKLIIFQFFVIHSGRRAGQAIVDHHDVRKVGFTGSTPVGADIMKRYDAVHLLFLVKSY